MPRARAAHVLSVAAGPCGPAGGVVSCDRNVWSPAIWLAIVCLLLRGGAPRAAQTVTSASVTGIVRDSSEPRRARRRPSTSGITTTNQVSQAVTDGARPLPDPVSAGRRLPPVGAVSRLHHRQRESEPRGRRSDRRADRAQARGASTESVQVEAPRRSSRRGAPSWRRRSRRSEIDSAAAQRPQLSRSRAAGAERVAHQPAHRPIASPKRRRCPAPASRSPASATSNNTFVVDGLSANDDAADLAGTYFSAGSDPRVPGGHLRRRRRVRPRVERHDQHRHAVGHEPHAAAAPTSSSATTRSTRRIRSATRKDPLNAEPVRLHASAARSSQDRTFWFANVERTQQDRDRHRHDRAGVGDGDQRARSTRPATAARGSRPGNFPTGYTTRPTCSAASITRRRPAPRLQVRYSLYDVTQRERAQRRRPERRQPRHGARRHRSDRRPPACCRRCRRATINEARAQYTRSRLGAPVERHRSGRR